jgi:hypothetical protein
MDEVNVEVSVIILLKVSRTVTFRVLSQQSHTYELLLSSFLLGFEVDRGSFDYFGLGWSRLTFLLFFRHDDLFENVCLTFSGFSKITHLVFITIRFHSLVGCKQVGHAVHVLEDHVVISVEGNSSGESLGSLPELLPILFRILGECSNQVPNGEVVIRVKHFTCDLHTGCEILLKVHDLRDSLQHRFNLVFACVFHLFHEVGRVFYELGGFFQSFCKCDTEFFTGPLNAMLDHEGERLEGAHGHCVLRSILDISITLGLVRNDHLGVGHHSKSSRF